MNKSAKILAFIGALTLLVSCDPSDQDTSKAKATAADAIASVPALPQWRRVIVREASDAGYSIAIDYAAQPKPGDVEEDTKRLARAVLGQLVKSGHKPATEFTVVRVSGLQSGFKGETGADLVRSYGTAIYDPKGDRITFDPAD